MIRREEDSKCIVRKEMMGGKGEIRMFNIMDGKELGGNCRLFSRVLIPYGSSIGTHRHNNEREIYFILKGEGTAEQDGEVIILKKGDTMIVSDGMTHAIRNESKELLELIAVIIMD